MLLPRITNDLPSQSIRLDSFDLPKDIDLADPNFHQPKRIDILLGVDVFWDLICYEHVDRPHLYKTQLGYVIAGRILQERPARECISCNLSISDVSNQLTRFWEVENCPTNETNKELSVEDQACESHFVHTVK